MEPIKEYLHFQIDDESIIDLFGKQNFADKEVAVLELVKNSFDAGATVVDLIIKNNTIIIRDNGFGMNDAIIKNNWMRVGFSEKNKNYEFKDIEGNIKIYSGSKGIGRFALARLGSDITVTSKKDGCIPVIWHTNWNENTLSQSEEIKTRGTDIVISKLKDDWKRTDITYLRDFLGKSIKNNHFHINYYFNDEMFCIINPFDEMVLGKNCQTSFFIKYDSDSLKLTFELLSCEFQDSVQDIIDNKRKQLFDEGVDNKRIEKVVPNFIDKCNKTVDLLELNIFDEEFTKLNLDRKRETLKNVGDFTANFYFNNFFTNEDKLRFMYRDKFKDSLIDKAFYSKLGNILYRNTFAIAGYNLTKDWLDISIRARKSPAAPTHKTGAWRVRDNQLCGHIDIDKKKNVFIRELQNRQGIENNKEYLILRQILWYCISIFEDHRQSIIRIVNEKNEPVQNSEIDEHYKVIKDFLKNKEKNVSKQDKVVKFASSTEAIFGDLQQRRDALIESQERLDYSARLLNLLATEGLISYSNAHELISEESNLREFNSLVINALKNKGLWDILDDQSSPSNNIPYMLRKHDKNIKKLIKYINSSTKAIEKQNFINENLNISEFVEVICDEWKAKYSWVNFLINVEKGQFYISKDYIETIFNNLILNSIQQNDEHKMLIISISGNIVDKNRFYFDYRDSGKGFVVQKYINDPYLILEPHETSREEQGGHGLGMWIVKNTIDYTNGDILKIDGSNGFNFAFYLGEMKNGK